MNFKKLIVKILMVSFTFVSLNANMVLIADKEEGFDTVLRVDPVDNDLYFSICDIRDVSNCESLGHISDRALRVISKNLSSRQKDFNRHLIAGTILGLGSIVLSTTVTGDINLGMSGAICGMAMYAFAPNADITVFPKNLEGLLNGVDTCGLYGSHQNIMGYEQLIEEIKPFLTK